MLLLGSKGVGASIAKLDEVRHNNNWVYTTDGWAIRRSVSSMSDSSANTNSTPGNGDVELSGRQTADLSGRQFGDFRLLRRLGRGAMAEVYLAEQAGLKRRVALKILKPELAEDATYLRRFEREAQAAASLVHANIVQIYEVGHIDQYHYIAQEYIEGQNLREYLSRNGPPDLPHSLSIMRQVAAALAKAAEQGVVHRDIKPENIMLTRSGEVKVADFGLARVSREGESAELTQIGITMGTPLYMSPEQVEGKQLDPRSDIYSLGVTCYHMLSGTPPFSGETALGVAVQHLKKDAKPLESIRPDLPPALSRTIHKMLAKSPDQRFQSARELLRELRRLQLEHCGEDWPEDLPGWETLGIELPEDSRFRTTQQLDGLMKTIALERPNRYAWLWLSAGVIAAFLIGGVIAWKVFAQAPLVNGGEGIHLTITRRDTALRQWYYASRIAAEEPWRAEEAWLSINKFFPKNQHLIHLADQQLALLYLHNRDDIQALKLFKQFTLESQDEFRVFGLAGQAGVLTLQGKYNDAAKVVEELLPIRGTLQNPQMKDMLDRTIQKIRDHVGSGTTKNWDKWLDEAFSGQD
jgi:eukaryotic-like serine/threonine-protein kinase